MYCASCDGCIFLSSNDFIVFHQDIFVFKLILYHKLDLYYLRIINMLVYSRNILFSMRNCWKSLYKVRTGDRPIHRPLSCYLWEKLKTYNLLSLSRGQRGGNHLRRTNGKAISTIKPFVGRQNAIAKQRGMNSANLLNIQVSILNTKSNTRITEVELNNNDFRISNHKTFLPRFCLMNVRSLLPKIDELSAFVSSTPIDIIAITESWLNEDIDSDILSIDNFNIHRNDRSTGRGGGVCAYISSHIPSIRRQDLENAAYECMWIWLRPYRLPRPLSGMMLGLVYCPPDATAQKQNDLVEYIISSVDQVQSAHPDCGIVILGDFNSLDITDILANHNLKQVVQDPTRGNNILDLIVTNLSHLYSTPVIFAPLGRSDHNTIMWSVDSRCTNNPARSCATKRYVRRFTQSSREAFGRWCSTHDWFSDTQESVSATNLTASFTSDLLSAIEQFFPAKSIKIHETDKPWMSPTVKELIIKRQRAFHSGNGVLWRYYRNKVQYEIRSRKRTYYVKKVQQLKSANPKKWWDCVKQMSGKKRCHLHLSILSRTALLFLEPLLLMQ